MGFQFILFSALISFFIIFLSLNFNSFGLSREKLSSYECGFEPMSEGRLSFCVRFFIVALMFLVFDVELVVLIAYILDSGFLNPMRECFKVFSFLVILVLGLYHEINEGSLDWS